MPPEMATQPQGVLGEIRAVVERNPASGRKAPEAVPSVLDAAELLSLDVPVPKMLVESMLPTAGACLMFGCAKSGKTLLAVQTALAVASNQPVFGYYRVLESGPTMLVEQDDPAGAASVKEILARSAFSVEVIPFYFVGQLPFSFGAKLLSWLGEQIESRGLRLVVLDSYTALRGPRGAGIDIVKAEQRDLSLLDELAKRTGCCILVIHHTSKGAAGLDWAERAAGTFAMSAATEAQIHISRFGELDIAAPERLVRTRGRHHDGSEMVLRFRKETLDYEHLMDGGASVLYPFVHELQAAFGTQHFSPKDLIRATGLSRRTAHRHIGCLYRGDVLVKHGYGQYALKAGCS